MCKRKWLLQKGEEPAHTNNINLTKIFKTKGSLGMSGCLMYFHDIGQVLSDLYGDLWGTWKVGGYFEWHFKCDKEPLILSGQNCLCVYGLLVFS